MGFSVTGATGTAAEAWGAGSFPAGAVSGAGGIMKRIVSAPWGEAVKAGGGGSVAFGSMTGIGSIGSIFTCDGAGFLARNSATTIGITSAIGACTIPLALSTHPAELSFSCASFSSLLATSMRCLAR